MRFAAMLAATRALAFQFWTRVDALWTASQVSRCGSYSVARLQAFDAYCRATSRKRVVAVCMLTPLPSLMFPLLLECIPLKPARLGWDANWTLWIRCAITQSMLTLNFITQARQVFPNLEIARWRLLCVAVCTGVSFSGTSMLIAALWAFPIPFAFVVTSMPFGCLMVLFFVLLVGTKPFARMQHLGAKLWQLSRVMAVQFTLITLYPIYSALFLWFSSEQQTLFLITLPALKLVMKNLMARTFVGTEMEDSIPEITIFSVEIFNSLYISACLQITSSAQLTTLLVIAIDVSQSIFMGRGVLQRAIVPQELQEHVSDQTLYASVHESCRQLRFLRGNMNADESLKSSTLAAATAVGPSSGRLAEGDKIDAHQFKRLFGSKISSTIVPTPSAGRCSQMTTVAPRSRSRDERTRIVKQTLAMLFNCEYLVLVEYIECVLPIVYSIYTSALFFLPNAVFYRHIQAMTSEDLHATMTRLGVYIALEVTTLLGLCLLLRWKLRFSALYQLAFVLETHMEVIQAKLFIWVTYSLTYGLEHAGMDFSLVIDWLKQETASSA